MKGLYPKQLEIAQAVQAMLGDVGIKVNIRNLEIAAAREQRTAGNYHIFFSGWAHMPHDPDWYFGQWFTQGRGREADALQQPDGRAAHRGWPRARPQGAPAEVRGDPADHLGGRGRDLAVLQRGHLRRPRPLRNFEARRDYYVLLHEVGIA